MAAFDFPGAPNPGDIFTDPTSGASWAWNGYAWMGGAANSLGALIVSDTPPAAPANNSLWFESDTGMLFLRYNDGNSSQWVQVNALPNGAGYMPLRGVSDGSDAPAGQIGEVISSNVTTGVPLTSNVTANVTSVTLTPGDWDISGEVWFSVGTGAPTNMQASLNTVSGTLATVSNIGTTTAKWLAAVLASTMPTLELRTARASLTVNTTYYLLAYLIFPSGTCTATGNIIARRAR